MRSCLGNNTLLDRSGLNATRVYVDHVNVAARMELADEVFFER